MLQQVALDFLVHQKRVGDRIVASSHSFPLELDYTQDITTVFENHWVHSKGTLVILAEGIIHVATNYIGTVSMFAGIDSHGTGVNPHASGFRTFMAVQPGQIILLDGKAYSTYFHASHPVVYRPIDYIPCSHQHVFNILRTSVSTALTGRSDAHILFSGGLDSTLLAALSTNFVKTIYLYNVSFDGFSAPDRITGLASYIELSNLYPKNDFVLILSDYTRGDIEAKQGTIIQAMKPLDSVLDFTISSVLYFATAMIGRKVVSADVAASICPHSLPQHLFPTEKPRVTAEPSTLESTCPVCHKYVPKSKCVQSSCKRCCRERSHEDSNYRCKAHRVGRKIFEDPIMLSSHDLSERYKTIIERLPVVDNSGCNGTLLIGSGADELFGGYARYKTKFLTGGMSAWREEAVSDLENIWSRNLFRDSRVIKTQCLNTVLAIPTENLMNRFYDNSEKSKTYVDEGKDFLRKIARDFCYLSNASQLKKRAMQFGTRAASAYAINNHLVKRKTKADDVIQPQVF